MVTVENLSFSYGAHPVLNNISLTLEEGRIYGLLGENGVGKTTFLTLLCGLKKPQTGRIITDGRTPYKREPSFLENQFYLSDEVAPVAISAARYAAEYGKFRRNFDMDKFTELMRLFETEPAQRMDRMSFGQLKKTYICFALACNCRYIYMDEPTNGLDIPSKSQFRKAITKYTSDDSTILISTHQVRDLENIIDPVIILDRQEVLLNASTEEISRRLFFDYGTQKRDDALYCEMTPGGSVQVCPNLTGEESKVSIEALFNTIHLHKDIVRHLMSSRS